MTFKKIFCALCCGSLLLAMAGCSENKSTVAPAESNSGQTTTAAKVTTKVTQTGSIGENAEMADVEIKINNVYKSEYFGSQDGVLSKVFFLDVTIENNTDRDIDTNMLTSFDFEVDGVLHDSATLYAIRCAKLQFGNDVNLFAETIKPGKSQTGCIPAELPNNFEKVTLSFLPLGGAKGGGDTSKAIVYTFTKDEPEELAKPDSSDKTENTETKTENTEE